MRFVGHCCEEALMGVIRRWHVLMVILGVAASLAVPAAHAAVPGSNGRIAFVSGRDGNLEIYTMEPDGASPVNLTSDPGDDTEPAWSPNGLRIAFVSDRAGPLSVWVMNADGSHQSKLGPGAHPAWSPDGVQIAFSLGSDIHVMNSDGSGSHQLTNIESEPGYPSWSTSSGYHSPAWSPDGSRLAVIRQSTGPTPLASYSEVYVIDSDGHGVSLNPGAGSWMADGLDWSPDGKQIAFGAMSPFRLQESITILNVDGSGSVIPPSGVAHDLQPAWAPDGSRIAFSSRTGYIEFSPLDIFVTSLDPSATPVNLTNNGASDMQPAWQVVDRTGVVRLAGVDRFGTAVAISEAFYGPGVDAAYVTRGGDFPDAVAAASAAAVRESGPILLTRGDALPGVVRAELARLQPKRIYVLGGPAAVSDGVVAELDRYTKGSVERLAGATRYDTAAAIASHFFSSSATAFVASGDTFPDALAGGPLAAELESPMLLVAAQSVPDAVMDELERLGVSDTIYLLGGPVTVSAEVERLLDSRGATVIRLSGSNRYETAKAVYDQKAGDWMRTAFIAVGTNFPDALAGGAPAGMLGAPLLLVERDWVSEPTATALRNLKPHTIYILGGSDVVTGGVAAELATYVVSAP